MLFVDTFPPRGPGHAPSQNKEKMPSAAGLPWIRETIYLHFPAPRLPYICILYAVKMDTALQTAFSVHAGFLLLHLFSYVINLLILLFVLLLGGYRPCCTKIETPPERFYNRRSGGAAYSLNFLWISACLPQVILPSGHFPEPKELGP